MLFKIWIILIFFYTQFQFNKSSFEDEYPGTKICVNDNLQEDSIRDINSKLNMLDQFLKTNCTHIQGSLYIRGFTGLPTDRRNLYLETIKEIDGHLIIEGNDFEEISFKNLRIIRGLSHRNRTLKNRINIYVSLEVMGNPFLSKLDFRSLQSITAHNVLFNKNPVLTYLPHRINWNELFSDSKRQKLVSSPTTPEKLNRDVCSKRCSLWNNSNDTYCWGALEDQCQKNVLCGPKYSKDCETCYYKDGKEESCCSDQCIGGCFGFGPTKCIACKSMLNEEKCTESCPGRYSGGIAGTTQNKGFKYHTGSFCSKTCPKLMLPEESTCVHKCSDGYFKNKTNHCVKCYGDMCKKDELPCEIKRNPRSDLYLNNQTLLQLKNCTKIIGYILITKDSFIKYGITVQLLYDNLKNLQDLEGGFSYFMDDHLKNLTFLSNLKSFRAAFLHSSESSSPKYNRFALMKTGIEFLGLKSLKSVYGNFLLHGNLNLCYVNFPKHIVTGTFLSEPAVKCDDKICDKECSNNSCWGPGNKMCFECKNFDAAGICIPDCKMEKGFYFPTDSVDKNGTCLKCHTQCAKTCNGPNSDQCIGGCLNKEEVNVCVANCSNNFYVSKSNKKLCSPCHNNCTDNNNLPKCTGPSSKPGKGGCNKCSRILLDNISNIIECVIKCPVGTYAAVKDDERFTQYFLNAMGHTCSPCHPQCRSCKGKSNKIDDCEICQGYFYRNSCVQFCPKADHYDIVPNRQGGHCKTCNSQCSGGCNGSSAFDCKKCKYKKIYTTGKKFLCARSCPVNKKEEEIEVSTGNTLCLAEWEKRDRIEEAKRTKVTVAVVLSMFALVVIVIVIIVICLRKKAIAERIEADLKARYSNLTEPNSKDEDFLNKPPNMGRLVIVSKDDLIFEDESRPLGFGAFGYVYKGKWRIPKEEDTLLKKTTGDFYLPVAIKVIKNMGNEELDSIMQEAKMMASVSHMHCLRFIGVCLSDDKPCLISAYVKEGSLDKYLIRNRNKISSLIMLSWCEQIADGMLYLTKRNIIHRDLAARNVLVNRLECVQITDFGLSKMLESSREKEIIIKTGKVPIRWLAIETLTEGKYSHETDVWAYGVTLWEIFTFGKVPYEDQATHDIFDFVVKGGRLSQPDICSLDVYIIMVNCWLESPNLRPDFQYLMKTFIDYCKIPGRYLSIQGDPYEIPSPQPLEMTNLNNPYYGDNFFPTTAETMLPLLNADTSDRGVKDYTRDSVGDSFLSTSDKEPLPTRSMNRTSNIFKRFQENRQPQHISNTRNSNTPRLVSLASQEEPHFRNQPQLSEDDPRYVADPTDKAIKMRPPVVKPQFLQETPRFHSNINRENNSSIHPVSMPHSSDITEEVDGYLEPVNKNNSISPKSSVDAEGYLEPINNFNKISVSNQDEYMVPSQPNTPRESLLNKQPKKFSNIFKESKNYITMDEDSDRGNSHLSKNSVDDEYLEPEPSRRLINSSYR